MGRGSAPNQKIRAATPITIWIKRNMHLIRSHCSRDYTTGIFQDDTLSINSNAQACYDRIIPEISMTISKKYGFHTKVIQILCKTLQVSKYFIRLGSIMETHKIFGMESGCSYPQSSSI
jgi:hypothetical protein